jgi:hypothetical protein
MKEQEETKRSRKRTPNDRTTTGFRISDELWAVLEHRFRRLLVPLGQKPGQLFGFSPFRLCLERFLPRRVIRMGSQCLNQVTDEGYPYRHNSCRYHNSHN